MVSVNVSFPAVSGLTVTTPFTSRAPFASMFPVNVETPDTFSVVVVDPLPVTLSPLETVTKLGSPMVSV